MQKIGWLDLTVQNATELRDFYAEVADFESQGIPMGEYEDYALTADGGGVAGVCHARGTNADLPPMWIPYFVVSDLEKSVQALERRGGSLIGGIRGGHGADRFAIFRDPAGAVAAVYQKG